jgi:uncharacterized protein (DUF4213/DUF364 family)
MTNDIYEKLRNALAEIAYKHALLNEPVAISCSALSAEAAIGKPEHQDYPIITGKEKMVEAKFGDSRGQAFTDSYQNAEYSVKDLLDLPLDNNFQRAHFIAALNAIYKHFRMTSETVHCRGDELTLCPRHLRKLFPTERKIWLAGLQPRFLEVLSENYEVRCTDMDSENIGQKKCGITISGPEAGPENMDWADAIFVTGSTVANGSIVNFLDIKPRVVFFGISIAATASILNLERYCPEGH